jgi:hypothetical protein
VEHTASRRRASASADWCCLEGSMRFAERPNWVQNESFHSRQCRAHTEYTSRSCACMPTMRISRPVVRVVRRATVGFMFG